MIHLPPDTSLIEAGRPPVRTPPIGDEVVNPGEFCAADGVLIAWSGWEQNLVADVAHAIADDYLVYMLVRDGAAEMQAYNFLFAHSVNLENVEFIHDSRISGSSMWIRDYGPFCIYENGDEAIVDFYYGTYPSDDRIPETIAAYFGLPYYDSDLLHHGGNHITDGNGMGFCSTNIWNYNPGFTDDEIRGIFRGYLGIDSLIVVEPMLGDITRHIDMFCKLLDDSLFIVGEYAEPGDAYPGDYDRLNNLAAFLSTVCSLDGRPFQVARIPMLPIEYGGPAGRTNRTYTNSLILNDKILVPVYGFETDSVALGIYTDLMPGYEIIGIDSSFIIYYAGAVHCMTNCIHSANPLIVFHQPIDSVAVGGAPRISFTINPRFDNTEASAFYKLASEEEFTEVPAEFESGVWAATLPPAFEDFDYYVAGTSISGANVLEVTLPDAAPLEVFEVEVIDYSAVVSGTQLDLRLRNYPNPGRAWTTIAFDLPTARQVKLGIYDVTGQLVRTLIDGERLAPSPHAIAWRGLDDRGQPLPAGIYLCRVDTEDARQVRRMVLVD